jgi:hypothetical protein
VVSQLLLVHLLRIRNAGKVVDHERAPIVSASRKRDNPILNAYANLKVISKEWKQTLKKTKKQ